MRKYIVPLCIDRDTFFRIWISNSPKETQFAFEYSALVVVTIR